MHPTSCRGQEQIVADVGTPLTAGYFTNAVDAMVAHIPDIPIHVAAGVGRVEGFRFGGDGLGPTVAFTS
jgi:hypothetical protein